MTITTKIGDQGYTNLLGTKVKKTSCAVVTLGQLDLLASAIGLCRTMVSGGGEIVSLPEIQVALLELCSQISTPVTDENPIDYILRWKTRWEMRTEHIDTLIANEENQEYYKGFYLYGTRGKELSSRLDYARAVCRQTEIVLWNAVETEGLIPEAVMFINRLSDYLWLLARKYGDLTDTVDNFKKEDE